MAAGSCCGHRRRPRPRAPPARRGRRPACTRPGDRPRSSRAAASGTRSASRGARGGSRSRSRPRAASWRVARTAPTPVLKNTWRSSTPSSAATAAHVVGRTPAGALVRGAHEHEPDLRPALGERRDRAHGGRRVEPVPDPAVPQHTSSSGPIASAKRSRGPGAPGTATGGIGREAERDHVQHRPQARVAVVVLRPDQALGHHGAEPEVALLLRRADQVVAVVQRVDDPVDGERVEHAAQAHAPVARATRAPRAARGRRGRRSSRAPELRSQAPSTGHGGWATMTSARAISGLIRRWSRMWYWTTSKSSSGSASVSRPASMTSAACGRSALVSS